MTWVIVGGLVMAVGTLAVIQWATTAFDETVARTMGLTVFSLLNILFALETANEDHSLFSPEARPNATLLKAAGGALIATLIATELGLLNRILNTTHLTLEQWGVCVLVSLSIIVIAEVRKLLKIRVTETATLVATPDVAPAAA
jgi:Ca2+-transporting ATPase